MKNTAEKPHRVMHSTTFRSISRFLSRAGALLILLSLSFTMSATIHEGGDKANGEKLFTGLCASCHHPGAEVVAAPGLGGVDARWKGKDELIKTWIKNPQTAIATGDAYVKGIVAKYQGAFGIMAAQGVNDQEINDILTYVKEWVEPPTDDPSQSSGPNWYAWDDDYGQTESNSDGAIWFIIILLICGVFIIFASNIRKQLEQIQRERAGKKLRPELTYGEQAKAWAFRNKLPLSLLGLFLTCVVVVAGYKVGMYDVGVYEGYRPDQPIKYSHKLHAGKNKIDCQYCHSTAAKSKHASIPSTNVCMNCHKGIKKGHNDEATAEIQKIYDAIGFDPTSGTYIEDYEEQPVEWIKVHNLPDHVYFSHKQHVAVGKLQCQNCHGPVEQEYTVGRIATPEEISNYEPTEFRAPLDPELKGIIPLEKSTLTMGWCIECHQKAEVEVMSADNGYYQEIHERFTNNDRGNEILQGYLEGDQALSVKELGGWECAKCHY